MTPFEFYFSFYGLLLGLSVAAVVSGMVETISERARIALGWLTPLLGLFVLLDITSFWLFAWGARDRLGVNWPMMAGGLLVAVPYYAAASLVFPRRPLEWSNLDEYYWQHKRLVVAGVMLSNVVVLGLSVGFVMSPLGRAQFWIMQALYWAPLAGLLFSRRRWLDLTLIGVLIAGYGQNIITVMLR